MPASIECAVRCVLCVGTGGSCSYCDVLNCCGGREHGVEVLCLKYNCCDWMLQVTCALKYVENVYMW